MYSLTTQGATILSKRSYLSDDPWLTLAEIAEELRVNPATVRLWVARGQLKATRAGQRKWLVRRFELDRMLTATSEPSPQAARESGEAFPAPPRRPLPPEAEPPTTKGAEQPGRVIEGRDAAELVRLADRNLNEALAASRYAPPSSGYLDRLRAIADGFEHAASALRNAASAVGLRWRGHSTFGWDDLPYELRPNGNRPGGPELWEDFDAAIERLSITFSGTDVRAVADAQAEVRDTLLDVVRDLGAGTSERDSWAAG